MRSSLLRLSQQTGSTLTGLRSLLAAVSAEVAEINKQLPQPCWEVKVSPSSESLIEGHYKLRNFANTWEFLNMIASLAHQQRHHPTITTTYNKICIELTTHDNGNRVTEKDTRLALAIQDAYYRNFLEKIPVKIEDASFFQGLTGLAHRTTKVVVETKKSIDPAEYATKVIDELTKRL